ncbi:MAG: choice-of-anchor J domain-containing protein, partial [Flavobacteriaceae bacterium]
MKKITLLAMLFVASIGFSQTVIWEDDFNDEDISDWTLYDEDGDGNNWSAVQIQEEDGTPVNTPVLRSASWNSLFGPLTPDNYAVSPAIDLTEEDGTNTITLTWFVSASDPAFSDENYTVYVASGNSVSDLTSASISFNELVSDNGPAGPENFYEKTLDLTSMAGETVYVGFRHHDVTDVFTMEIDDVSVTTEPNAANDQFAAHNFKFY